MNEHWKEKVKTLVPKSIFDHDFGKENIGFCTNTHTSQLLNMMHGTVIVPRNGNLKYIPVLRQTKLNLIFSDDPKSEFFEILESFDPIHPTLIHPTVKIGKNTVIHDGTLIQDGVIIGDNCTIGSEGFGYYKGKKVPHKGIVRIKSGTIIHNNTCIDRAVVGETVIGKNNRIDNLVHIAHGVKTGDNNLIIAGSVVCGSVTIGNDCWIAPNTTIREHLKIGNGVKTGIGSVITKDIPDGWLVAGVPAKRMSQ